ncbi:hypothetical protein [Gordonia shandongensis]|uniref:hypothetical protein n=1 Tax=Gordonia shandongensis TaxID=376351 RepID=UPI001FDF7BB4|nr:hypothetical protein [Gordonia shandongensis]
MRDDGVMSDDGVMRDDGVMSDDGVMNDDGVMGDDGVTSEDEVNRDGGVDREDAAAPGGSGIQWSTVLASAGVAAVISALIVSIGLVGVMVSGSPARTAADASPATVVNLGDAQTPAAPAQATAPETPADDTPVADDAPEGTAPPSGAGAPDQNPSQPSPATRSSNDGGPTTPTLAMFNGQLSTLSGASSTAQKAAVLEGGTAAVTPISKVLKLAKQYAYTGLTYKIVGPLKVNGTTATARLQMSVPTMGTRHIPLTWVWKDGAWKLTNKSVCAIAAYSQQECNL